MNKRAIVVTGLILAASSLYLLGGQIPPCLGPLGVTTAECLSRLAPTGVTWAPGPSPGTASIVGPAIVLFVLTLIPWRRLRRVQVFEVGVAAVGAATLGALYYDFTRPMSLTQTNEFSHRTYTAILADNPDLRILTALFAAAIVAPTIGWMLAFRGRFSKGRSRHLASETHV